MGPYVTDEDVRYIFAKVKTAIFKLNGMNLSTKHAFLSLVRLGIGHVVTVLPEVIDWETIRTLASAQGLSAIVLDGAQVIVNRGELKGGRAMDVMLKKRWIGDVIQNHERKYQDYRVQIGQLARFFYEQGFKMMVLKGYGLSLNYPIPEHRPCGDIDIWTFGQYKQTDAALNRKRGIEIDTSHHHHTVFHWNGYLVENHYDWVNVYADRSSAEMETIFKELAMDDSCSVEIDGYKVYLPSPNLHALFLIKHSMSHFSSTSITIRQLLDWGLFVEKNTMEIDWDWLRGVLVHFHLLDFFTCLNAICIADLGFEATIFPPMQVDLFLKERVLDDILSPEFTEKQPSNFIKRLFFKYRRWRANEWKHKMCYNESMFSSFLSGVWAKVMKPASI